MKTKFLILTILSIIFSSVLFSSNSYAAARGTACNFTTTPATGADGSNCDATLFCDPKTKICGLSSDVMCSNLYGCTVGTKCYTLKSDGTIGNTVTLGSTTAATGVCLQVDGNTENNAFGDALCGMLKFITGKVGRGIAVGAVVSMGYFLFMGKVTWGSCLAVALGVGALFGAPAIVKVLTGRGFDC